MAIKPVSELVAEAKTRITTLSLEDARAALETEGTLFVDIRDVRELQREGKIPGAMHVPRGMLEFWIDPASPYHKPALLAADRLVLYCASAWRSALSVRTLQEMGVETATEIDGGFTAWRKADYPIEAG